MPTFRLDDVHYVIAADYVPAPRSSLCYAELFPPWVVYARLDSARAADWEEVLI
jgi:hypothetical protein